MDTFKKQNNNKTPCFASLLFRLCVSLSVLLCAGLPLCVHIHVHLSIAFSCTVNNHKLNFMSQILQDALNGEESDVVFAQFYSLVPLGKLTLDCTVLYVWPSASMCESLLHRDCCVAW